MTAERKTRQTFISSTTSAPTARLTTRDWFEGARYSRDDGSHAASCSRLLLSVKLHFVFGGGGRFPNKLTCSQVPLKLYIREK